MNPQNISNADVLPLSCCETAGKTVVFTQYTKLINVCEQVLGPTHCQDSEQWQHGDVPGQSGNDRNTLVTRKTTIHYASRRGRRLKHDRGKVKKRRRKKTQTSAPCPKSVHRRQNTDS
ncbi:hypothetical protein MHYP_G00222810 [Metynnis hypsauchen]